MTNEINGGETLSPVVETNHKKRNRAFGAAAGVAVIALGASAAVFGGGEGSSNPSDNSADSGTQYDVESGCDNLVQSFAAANGDNYTATAFLPKFDTTDAEEVVDNLFDENGPLSNKGDFASLAAFTAAISGPANDGAVVDPNYNVPNAFGDYFNQFTTNGDVAAKDACSIAYNTALETATYNTDWAVAGETVTEFVAIRDGEYKIVGGTMTEIVTIDDVEGVEFKYPSTQTGLDGFTEVLYEKGTGRMYFRGVTAGIGSTVDIDGAPVSIDPEASTTIPVDTIVDSNGNKVTVTTIVDENGNTIQVTIDPNTGEAVPVTPTTGPSETETPANGTTAGGGSNGTTNGNNGAGTGTEGGGGGSCGGGCGSGGGEGGGCDGSCGGTTTPGTTPVTTTPGTTTPGTTVPATTTPGTTVPATTVPATTVPATTTPSTTVPSTTPTTTVKPCPPGYTPAPTGGCKAPQPATTTTVLSGF